MVIRPLAYAYEKEIECFCKDHNIVPVPHPCPYSSASDSKRKQIKQWLDKFSRTNPTIKGNLLKAVLKDQRKTISPLSNNMFPH